MSLLMKALGKAAQDRDKAPAANAAAPSQRTEPELSLEAMEARSTSAPQSAQGGAERGTNATARTGYAAPRGSSADTARSGAQAQAASVLASGWQPRRIGALDWMRAHPLYVFGTAAALFLAVYGAYVYVQIAHPSWLLKTPASAPVVAIAPAPALPPAPAPAPSERAAASDTQPPERGVAPAIPDNTGTQLAPLQSVFGRSGDVQAPVQPAPDLRNPSGFAPPPRPTSPPAATPRAGALADAPAAALPPAMQNKIAISRGDTAAPRVNPAVSDAYAAFQSGQFDLAQRLYSQALRTEPTNTDALLGLAAIAQRENRNDDAQRLFMSILDIEPRHAIAQSGLIAMMARADPQAAESRLKQLVAREPAAPLYFNLGNLYAEQGQWSQAQQAYFQAHHLEPRNPDYAYNLAVGLEHLGQQKLALDFYRKALQLATAAGSVNFDSARAQERIAQLAARLN